MSKPYCIVSDVHAHRWSQFAHPLATGMNSRLEIILSELRRAADVLLAAGGTSMLIAGDLFHVRGVVHPDVLNPVIWCFREIISKGVQVAVIPGNHDLGSKETDELSNAIVALGSLGVQIVHNRTGYYFNSSDLTSETLQGDILMVPWWSSSDELLSMLKGVSESEKDGVDLIIHAPLNGVIKGIPDHGLDPVQLAALGFNRVFVGHYHNHKEFGGGIYSIGATTHQTWNDVDTKAGFLMVYPESVVHIESQAPKFIDLDESTDPEEFCHQVIGNYVRVKLAVENHEQAETFRQEVMDLGAKGCIVQAQIAKKAVTRSASVASAPTVMSAIKAYIDAGESSHKKEVYEFCESMLGAPV